MKYKLKNKLKVPMNSKTCVLKDYSYARIEYVECDDVLLIVPIGESFKIKYTNSSGISYATMCSFDWVPALDDLRRNKGYDIRVNPNDIKRYLECGFSINDDHFMATLFIEQSGDITPKTINLRLISDYSHNICNNLANTCSKQYAELNELKSSISKESGTEEIIKDTEYVTVNLDDIDDESTGMNIKNTTGIDIEKTIKEEISEEEKVMSTNSYQITLRITKDNGFKSDGSESYSLWQPDTDTVKYDGNNKIRLYKTEKTIYTKLDFLDYHISFGKFENNGKDFVDMMNTIQERFGAEIRFMRIVFSVTSENQISSINLIMTESKQQKKFTKYISGIEEIKHDKFIVMIGNINASVSYLVHE